jgi:ABC-type sugar transport system substrate-binding protein
MKKIIKAFMSASLLVAMTGCSASSSTEEDTAAAASSAASTDSTSSDDSIYRDADYWKGLDPEDDITWKITNEKYNKVCLIIPDSTSEFYSEIATTVEGIMTENGYDFDFIGVNKDSTNAIAAIETWVAQGTDAIIIMAQDNTCDDALKAAMEQGVLVVSASAEIENYHHWLRQDNYDVGYQTAAMAADWLNETYPDDDTKQYIVMLNDKTEATADKGKGCLEGMEELYPNGELVGTVNYNGDATQTQSDVETLLTQYPDVKAVVAMHNTFSLLALEAANTLGLAKKGEFGVFGSALSQQVIDYLKAGDTCYEGEIWMGDQGRQMANNTLALLNGETLKRWYYAKNFPITSDNIDTYYEEYYAE